MKQQDQAEKLNWFRDFFIRTDYLTLLWIEEKYLGVLAREVPDFWRLRTKIFNFHMRPELTKTVLVLSYNKSDKDFVLKLFPAISKDYDVIIWTYDETNAMPDNMQIKNVINESVKVFFIPVLSSNYLSTSYQAINEKLRKFIPHTNIGIVPILHENVEIPTELNAYKYIDFTQDFENGLYNLVIELDLSLKLKSNIKILHRQQLEELETAKANKETNLIKQVRKPLKFRTEKELLVGRVNYINEIQNFLIESKDPISIIGIGGIGKSTLAFKVMHKCEHIFDLIIPIYFESGLTFDDFLLELCKGLDLRIDQFEKLSFENRQQVLIDTLANYRQKVLIYLDNYENVVFGSLGMVHINDFLQSISSSTAILLTSRMTKNLARERRFMLGGLSVEEGTELFIRLADSLKPSEDIRRAIMKIVQGVGGHPLSIEILARNYKGSGLEGIENIFKNLDLNIVNPVEEEEHLRPVQASFAYSINALDLKLRNLLSNLSFFKSPFTFSL